MLHSLSIPDSNKLCSTTAHRSSSSASFSYREDNTKQNHCPPLSPQEDHQPKNKKKTHHRSSNKLLTEDVVTKIKGYLQRKVLYQVISQETGVSLYYIRKISKGEDVLQSVEDNRDRLRSLRGKQKLAPSAQNIIS